MLKFSTVYLIKLVKLKLPALLTISSFLFVGCSSTDSRIAIVQKSSVQGCPQSNIKEMVDNFVDRPKWSAFVAEDNKDYVELEGGITYDDQPVDMVLQYNVDTKNESWEFAYLGLNDISQNIFMYGVLIEAMCSEVSN